VAVRAGGNQGYRWPEAKGEWVDVRKPSQQKGWWHRWWAPLGPQSFDAQFRRDAESGELIHSGGPTRAPNPPFNHLTVSEIDELIATIVVAISVDPHYVVNGWNDYARKAITYKDAAFKSWFSNDDQCANLRPLEGIEPVDPSTALPIASCWLRGA
jgi:hypothetical protein